MTINRNKTSSLYYISKTSRKGHNGSLQKQWPHTYCSLYLKQCGTLHFYSEECFGKTVPITMHQLFTVLTVMWVLLYQAKIYK